MRLTFFLVFPLLLVGQLAYSARRLSLFDLQVQPFWLYPKAGRTGEILIPPPKPERKSLIDQLLTQSLIEEFRRRYEDTFGPLELLYLTPDFSDVVVVRYRSFELTERETIVEENRKLRSFGRYMANRLIEFNLDQWLRENPQVRPVYDTKERLTKARVEVAEKTSVNLNYSVSGNFLEAIMTSPIVESRITWELGEGETIYSLARNFAYHYRFETSYRSQEGRLTFLGKKKIHENLTGTLRLSGYVHRRAEVDNEYESLLLAGINYRY